LQPEGYDLAYAEYRVGDYQRSFSLSSQVDQEHIEATLKDGVLRLCLPKAGPTTKKIAVKTG
jgi:HSP20 family molecular chaperone IbpA